MKTYVDIEEFESIDELLDMAEFMHGPGAFVKIGRMNKRNVGSFDEAVAEHDERVVWPGERVVQFGRVGEV